MSGLRQWAGRALYRCYYAPRGYLERMLKPGGLRDARANAVGQRAMEAAAAKLPTLQFSSDQTSCELHLLTGRRFWYQSAFCLYSFSRYAERNVVPIFYDDGTLSSENCDALLRLFPRARFMRPEDTQANLEQRLPRKKFPALRERWDHYVNLRKLIDPHLGSSGWKLVIDSDLLFFRKPAFILNWLDAPEEPLHSVDSETSYGYSPALMQELAGGPIAPRINVGLCGLRSEEIDWEKLEAWTCTLIEREGTHYYLEQALAALLLAGRTCAITPETDYVTLPRLPEATACRAVMHHYVADSKRWFFQQNWHRLVQP